MAEMTLTSCRSDDLYRDQAVVEHPMVIRAEDYHVGEIVSAAIFAGNDVSYVATGLSPTADHALGGKEPPRRFGERGAVGADQWWSSSQFVALHFGATSERAIGGIRANGSVESELLLAHGALRRETTIPRSDVVFPGLIEAALDATEPCLGVSGRPSGDDRAATSLAFLRHTLSLQQRYA